MNEWKELESQLAKLKANVENVGMEKLLANYRKPYETLVRKIEGNFDVLLRSYLGAGLPHYKSDAEELSAAMTAYVANHQDDVKKAKQVLLETYDIKKALSAAVPLRTALEHEIYVPYWLEHVEKCDDGTYYSTIVGMYWNGRIWTDGHHMAVYFPPTKELCDEERRLCEKN